MSSFPIRISVAGVALDSSGAVLLMRRSSGGGEDGLWEFPGGKAESGESPREALRREWLEETGFDVEVGSELTRTGFQHEKNEYTLIAYEIKIAGGNRNPELREHDGFRWFLPAEVRTISLVDSDRKVAESLFS